MMTLAAAAADSHKSGHKSLHDLKNTRTICCCCLGWFASFLQDILMYVSDMRMYISIRYHSRLIDCLVHPSVSATMASDQK